MEFLQFQVTILEVLILREFLVLLYELLTYLMKLFELKLNYQLQKNISLYFIKKLDGKIQ